MATSPSEATATAPSLEKSLPPQDEYPIPTDVVAPENSHATPTNNDPGVDYTIFTKSERRFIIFMASFGALFSPLSANIYFPALNALSADLHVSNSLINLTITSYMIFQGLAPTIIGNISETAGRRPAYIICFAVYIGANIGLALQSNYAALLVLRCVQSSGSSGTVALANAIVADITTTSERGKYIGYATAGSLLGPAVGPVIGGILSQFLGWRAIFWALTILAVFFFVPFLLFVPETCRKVVGDGSIPPQGWSVSVLSYMRHRKLPKSAGPIEKPALPHTKRSSYFNPLVTLKILFDKEAGLVLLYAGIVFAGFYAVTAAVASQFNKIYGYNDLVVGLCFIPVGTGSALAALTQGKLVDRNYRRHAKRLNVEITQNRQQELEDFPIEKARIQVAMPMVYLGSAIVIGYGWLLQAKTHISGPLIFLFFIGYAVSSSFNVVSALMIDVYPESPAMATAAQNLARCLLGAGATALVVPMVDAIGNGWTYTFVGLLWAVLSPMLWAVMRWGVEWRQEKKAKLEARQRRKNVGDVAV